MTIDETIKILRQHNITGASVQKITNGKILENDLLAQVLNACESLMTERTEYKRLLKAAVEDVNFSSICLNRDACKTCAKRYNISCEKKFEWRYADEALKLMGDEPNGV